MPNTLFDNTNTLIVRAPVRISFGGGGTDLATYYQKFDGFVISAAINHYCYVIAQARHDGIININSSDYKRWTSYDIRERQSDDFSSLSDDSLSLPRAAIKAFFDYGLRKRGIDLFLASEIPPGTGLGSSSAMASALVYTLALYTKTSLDKYKIAELASLLEIEYLHQPIGKQDQYAATFGGLNTISFTKDKVDVVPLGLSVDTMNSLNKRLMIFSTDIAHRSSFILHEQRERTSTDLEVIETLHNIRDLAKKMKSTLLKGDLDGFGDLLDQNWREKRKLSQRISTKEIDTWYSAAQRAGAQGGKITGAGGRGFLLLCCPLERREKVCISMRQHGLQELPFTFDMIGTCALATHPQD